MTDSDTWLNRSMIISMTWTASLCFTYRKSDSNTNTYTRFSNYDRSNNGKFMLRIGWHAHILLKESFHSFHVPPVEAFQTLAFLSKQRLSECHQQISASAKECVWRLGFLSKISNSELTAVHIETFALFLKRKHPVRKGATKSENLWNRTRTPYLKTWLFGSKGPKGCAEWSTKSREKNGLLLGLTKSCRRASKCERRPISCKKKPKACH